MTAHASKRALVRGASAIRGDSSNPNAILAELKAAFEAFKAANDQKMADVVHTEKVDRINADLGRMQAALDAMAAKQAAQDIGGSGRKVRDAEYNEAFASHVRKGQINAALNKGTAAEGGFVTPIEWDRTISDKLVEFSPMRQVATIQPVSNAGFSKLFNNKGTVSGWVGEAAARPETATPTFGSLNYAFGEIYANPAATQQFLDDAEVDIETWLAGEVQQKFAVEEALAFISGNGTNRPNGILTYVTGGANATAHPYGAITTVNTGAAATLTASDSLVNLVYALPSAFRGNARFAMNRNVELVIRKLKDGQGNYLWQPSFTAGAPATLLGYPITEMADLPDFGPSSKSVLFGDFRQAYLILDRMGVRVLRDPYYAKPYVMFYTTKRVGGGILDPMAMKALNTSV